MGLHPDSIVNTVEIRETAIRVQTPAARSDTERFLSRYEHTEHQLMSYLYARKYHERVIDDTLEWAERNGLVDDKRYASIYIRSHSDSSPMGNFRIRMELGKRGIPESITDGLLADRDESDLQKILVKTVKEKYGHLEKKAALRRAMGYLRRRGFRYDLIGTVVDLALTDEAGQTD